ncbi:MAG TPA: hypothetical protein VFU29_19555 [Chitinophagaceae bacterium]|nr:hypothetical protein [Chitinophagaceae bacterium]
MKKHLITAMALLFDVIANSQTSLVNSKWKATLHGGCHRNILICILYQ